MDSLKIPKAGLSSSPTHTVGMKSSNSGGVPISVHFNAGEESVDDIFPNVNVNNGSGSNSNNAGTNAIGGSSTNNIGGNDIGSQSNASPSHQQQNSQTNVDEQARNFLQGNFFNKRSSIEGVSPTSIGPNLIAALANADSSSRGTWKLFKGKVTQKIEDIKLSKSNSQNSLPITAAKDDPDSDLENNLIDPSISDDPNIDKDSKQQQQQHHHHIFKNLIRTNRQDSDSEGENDIGLEGDIEQSRLRRGFENLKQRVKAKTTQPQITVTSTLSTAKSNILAKTMKKDTSPTRATVPPLGITSTSQAPPSRSGFLRRRKKQAVEAADIAADDQIEMKPPSEVQANTKKSFKTGGIQVGRKEIEIESGVEMLEDMIPQSVPQIVNANLSQTENNEDTSEDNKRSSKALNMDLPLEDLTSQQCSNKNLASSQENTSNISSNSSKDDTVTSKFGSFSWNIISYEKSLELITKHFNNVLRFGPSLAFAVLLICLLLPIPDFVKGIFTCLLSIIVVEAIGKFVQNIIESFLAKHQPEKCNFQIPDYTTMPICKLPAVEEHKNCKYYSGWMNEANTYDPNTFHLSQTKPIYLKLEGSILQVSTTNARIPKRVMWNEQPIDLTKIIFTSHRVYNLLDCRIELLPVGLAKKRFFNRKYPIQLIIKSGQKVKQPSSIFLHEKNAGQDSNQEVNQTNESSRDSFSRPGFDTGDSRTKIEADFASTILNADFQPLQDLVNPDEDLKEIAVPCGDEVRLLLFSRGDREKEDWYRRFLAASSGNVHDQDLGIPNIKLVDDDDIQAAASKSAQQLINSLLKNNEDTKNLEDSTASSGTNKNSLDSKTPDEPSTKSPIDDENRSLGGSLDKKDDEIMNGMIMSSCVSRNPVDYIQFMAIYQAACTDNYIPVFKKMDNNNPEGRRRSRHRRFRSKDNELWQGIDQNLFLGPSGSVVWANVLIGRVLFSCLNDTLLHGKIQEFLQKKLNSLRLPSFMEEVLITEINVGNTPPLIHRISQPLLDERGIWLDADITYEGLANITVTTKLNLLRLRRPTRSGTSNPSSQVAIGGFGADSSSSSLAPPTIITSTTGLLSSEGSQTKLAPDWQLIDDLASEDPVSKSGNAIYDSNAESSGGSDTESDSLVASDRTEANPSTDFFTPASASPGNARRIFKLVDKITTSQIFQYATELSYVQRAMENMNATITLRVDIKGVVGRATINMPPPPSDRIWLCFRTPPRLWISGHPTVGDKSVDWSIVTNVIESKLCEEVNKYLVFPNMVDITIPFLGQPTYSNLATKEKE